MAGRPLASVLASLIVPTGLHPAFPIRMVTVAWHPRSDVSITLLSMLTHLEPQTTKSWKRGQLHFADEENVVQRIVTLVKAPQLFIVFQLQVPCLSLHQAASQWNEGEKEE